MVQPIHSDPRYQIESQVRECYGRCAYTHKTHEKMAERFDRYQSWLKWVNIVLSALIAGGAVGALFDANSPLSGYSGYASYATAILAISSLIFNSCIKEFDPATMAQKHREAASSIWKIRESYLSLITDALDDAVPLATLRTRRETLQNELGEVYSTAPLTDGTAYRKAQDGIKNREELTFSENELDLMLPNTLRRAGRKSGITPN